MRERHSTSSWVRGQGFSPRQAASAYDRIGRLQDWQSFYEGPALRELLAHGGFDSAMGVLELGCGTGALAERLLAEYLTQGTRYLGLDVSATMVRLGRERLHRWAPRARVVQVDGGLPLPGEDGAFDRFLVVYVFDLMGPVYAAKIVREAARLLAPGGLLCAVSLTSGVSPVGRGVSAAWRGVWERWPGLVGGCRPVDLNSVVGSGWTVRHHTVVTGWGVASQVLVAEPPPG